MSTYSLGQLYRAVPAAKRANGVFLPPSGRAMGIRIAATKGTGKTRLVSRILMWGDFLQGVAQVAIDPVGGMCDEFLDKFRLLPPDAQRALSERVRYIDMAGGPGTDGEKRVTPFPLYTRESGDELFDTAQNYLEIVRRIDPALQKTPILGENAVRDYSTDVGMVLAALGWQLSEAEALLRDPRRYEGPIRQAQRAYPEIAPAADFLLDTYPRLSANERNLQTKAYESKLRIYSRHPVQRALYGGGEGIDWQRVVDGKQTVLLDFHRMHRSTVQFAILNVYLSLMRFVQRRGPGKGHAPLALLIDEITFLLGNPLSQNEVNEDLVHLIDRVSRSHNIWLTLIHQELNQISPRVELTLRRCGTQILGSTSDPDDALAATRRFFPYQPHLVKDTNTVYGSYEGEHYAIDEHETFFSIQEQQELHGQKLMGLEPFHFLIGISERDGKLPRTLTEFSMEHIDRDIYVDPAFVADAKRKLLQRDGRRVQDVLAAITARTGGVAATTAQSRDEQPKRYVPPINLRERAI